MIGLIVQLIVSILAGLLVGSLLGAGGKSRKTYIFASAGTTVVTLGLMMWLAQRPPEMIQVKVIDPTDGATVSMRTVVKGIVQPPDATIYVAVHPVLSDVWWIQPQPIMFQDGSWRQNIVLGDENHGVNEKFEVLALATRESLLMRWIRGTDLAWSRQIQAIPKNVAKSPIILIVRTE